MPYKYSAQIIQQLWRPDEGGVAAPQIYAILDGARDRRIYPTLVSSDAEFICLYKGEIPKVLAEAAPYLVQLKKDSEFTDWVLRFGWGESWGIFVKAPTTIENLRRHFRQFLMAQTEDGKQFYFRYYDPRVWRVYLPTCNKNELEEIFGPVQRYYVEGEDADTLIEYVLNNSKLARNVVELKAVAATI
jgi:hypothetical protein